jgi:hypothetical protein
MPLFHTENFWQLIAMQQEPKKGQNAKNRDYPEERRDTAG